LPGRARAAALVVSMAALALFSGCSALRLGYNQADKFVYYWLDGYAGFDDAQEKRVREGIAGWFAWNRRTQLNDYADLLLRIEADTRSDTTPERVCSWWKEIRARIDRGLDQAVPAIADLATTLKPGQFDKIAQKQAKSVKEFRDDFMQPDPAKRQAEALKRAVNRTESLYGDLDSFQKERLDRLVAESPYDPALGLEELKRRQGEALQLLRRLSTGQVDKATAQTQVRNFLRRVDPPPQEPYRQHNERVIQHNCRVFAAVHNSASPEQRLVASKKLRGWADDLRVLAAEPVE
jgi:hypothetical protein